MGVDHQISDELEGMGYQPQIVVGDTPNGRKKVATFPYRVQVGRFKGMERNVGISTQCEALGYPELPPHWILANPPILDTKNGANHGIYKFAGKEWVALSRPPGAFWDRIQQKGMRAYLEHLSNVWYQI